MSVSPRPSHKKPPKKQAPSETNHHSASPTEPTPQPDVLIPMVKQPEGSDSEPSSLQHMAHPRTAFRILVVGQAGVGKKALTVRFVTKRFIGEDDPNLGDGRILKPKHWWLSDRVYRHTSEVDENPASFEILDTAGQEDNSELLEWCIEWANAFLLVYDICDVCSFTEVTRLKLLINDTKKRVSQQMALIMNDTKNPRRGRRDPLVFLLANKKDLDSNRMVPTEEGQSKADELNCTKFYEISVRESCEDVVEIFHELYRQSLIRALKPSTRSGSDEPVLETSS